jgi:hypothetical protein
MFGHLLTRGSAAAAHVRASLHLGIIGKLGAIVGALLAYFSTDAACLAVEMGTPQHEIGADLADLSAVLQHADVTGLGVLTALLQAITDCLQADAVAIQTILNTLLHLLAQLLPHWIRHYLLL